MTTSPERSAAAAISGDELRLSLQELARGCEGQIDWLVELVHEGVIEPEGDAPDTWRFASGSLKRVRVAWRLTRDLQLNVPGTALVLQLLDEIEQLKRQLSFAR
jgi:chaperone modulatory protein CbpM